MIARQNHTSQDESAAPTDLALISGPSPATTATPSTTRDSVTTQSTIARTNNSASPEDPRAPIPRNRKRATSSSVSDAARKSRCAQSPDSGSRRKLVKVSRACDHCKSKKLKCTGTLPCEICVTRGRLCQYDAQYRRGRPPTPPTAPAKPGHDVPNPRQAASDASAETQPYRGQSASFEQSNKPESTAAVKSASRTTGTSKDTSATHDVPLLSRGEGSLTSRGTPDLESTEIEGQFFDPTSNLTFLHRAWRRFHLQKGANVPDTLNGSENLQPLSSAGDKPFMVHPSHPMMLPDRMTATRLLEYYYEKCVVTYRCIHRQLCENWKDTLMTNMENNLPLHHDIAHARAAIIIIIFAITTLRQEKVAGNFAADDGSGFVLKQSDQYFCAATSLLNEETGLPRLESVQARLLQVLYLLQTGRMNQAWYSFGNAVPIMSALGLHRRSSRQPPGGGGASTRGPGADYINSQCRKRTFWTLYTIDKYLAVVFGRARLVHDDDIDQDFPDRVNDEDMDSQGPTDNEPAMDCHIDSLIAHAKIARIVDNISRDVYSLKKLSESARLHAATRFNQQLKTWRSELPPFLGTVRPRSLMPIFRRQATALKLAWCHAVMHANRPFLLSHRSDPKLSAEFSASVAECISAAGLALETVDSMVTESQTFHAFWWTPYTTFCALAVVYVWEIQQRKWSRDQTHDAIGSEYGGLLEMAERCQSYLAQATASDSPSTRYSIILEELRLEARQMTRLDGKAGHGDAHQQQTHTQTMDPGSAANSSSMDLQDPEVLSLGLDSMYNHQGDASFAGLVHGLDGWQAIDWLDLDSSAFGSFPGLEGSAAMWMANLPDQNALDG